jgi:hypothetical protein
MKVQMVVKAAKCRGEGYCRETRPRCGWLFVRVMQTPWEEVIREGRPEVGCRCVWAGCGCDADLREAWYFLFPAGLQATSVGASCSSRHVCVVVAQNIFWVLWGQHVDSVCSPRTGVCPACHVSVSCGSYDSQLGYSLSCSCIPPQHAE